ncbi:Rhodanese-like domain-containing protein [Hyaloraphidium curvatum]|nr:Rhodanese-like domain-containing protein [Hyaloraphidium curvatum]
MRPRALPRALARTCGPQQRGAGSGAMPAAVCGGVLCRAAPPAPPMAFRGPRAGCAPAARRRGLATQAKAADTGDAAAGGAVPDVVDAEWLASRLGTPRLAVFDATWFPRPALTEDDDRYWRRGFREALYGQNAVRDAWTPRDAKALFAARRIPGARFLDIDGLSDAVAKGTRRLPIAEDFAQRVSDMRVSNEDHVVLYDSRGMLSAPRAHWLFKCFGHARVSVLDGGLPAWLAEGRPVDEGEPDRRPPVGPPTRYVARLDDRLFLDYQRMWDCVLNNFIDPDAHQVVDARLPRVHRGELLDAIHGPRTPRGHIPGSTNVPYPAVLGASGRLLHLPDLAALFDRARIDLSGRIVVYSGSNVTAALVRLALLRAGAAPERTALFDGGWADWASKRDSPIKGRRPAVG